MKYKQEHMLGLVLIILAALYALYRLSSISVGNGKVAVHTVGGCGFFKWLTRRCSYYSGENFGIFSTRTNVNSQTGVAIDDGTE